MSDERSDQPAPIFIDGTMIGGAMKDDQAVRLTADWRGRLMRSLVRRKTEEWIAEAAAIANEADAWYRRFGFPTEQDPDAGASPRSSPSSPRTPPTGPRLVLGPDPTDHGLAGYCGGRDGGAADRRAPPTDGRGTGLPKLTQETLDVARITDSVGMLLVSGTAWRPRGRHVEPT